MAPRDYEGPVPNRVRSRLWWFTAGAQGLFTAVGGDVDIHPSMVAMLVVAAPTLLLAAMLLGVP